MTFSSLFRSLPISLLYCILLFPIPLYFYWGTVNQLGPDPLRFLEHKYGELGLIFLLITLSISPLFKYAKINLMRYRRCIGLVAFYYIVSHICVYFFLDIGLSIDILLSDLQKRYYIIAGFFAFITLIPLALTSNNFALRKLNIKTWNKIHSFVYIAIILSIFHFILMSKTWTGELYFYTGITIFILILKIKSTKFYKKLSTYFNADISKWNVEKVTNMEEMFTNAKKFKADIGATWSGDAATTEQDDIFFGADAFNELYECETPTDGPVSSCEKVRPPSPWRCD